MCVSQLVTSPFRAGGVTHSGPRPSVFLRFLYISMLWLGFWAIPNTNVSVFALFKAEQVLVRFD